MGSFRKIIYFTKQLIICAKKVVCLVLSLYTHMIKNHGKDRRIVKGYIDKFCGVTEETLSE